MASNLSLPNIGFTGNSNQVVAGANAKAPSSGSLPRVPFTVHQSFGLPTAGGSSVKAYLNALAAVNANSAAAANTARQQQQAALSAPGGVVSGGGGSVAAAPTGSGNPVIDALNAQLSSSQQQQTNDVNTQNANAQASRDRIAQGSTALQGQLSSLGQQNAAANATSGQSVQDNYAHALQTASAGNSAVNADLAAQGAQSPQIAAQQAQRQQDLQDQQARQTALQTRLSQISGNDFQSKQANAASYTSGAGAVLEAALQKNLGTVNTNATAEQQKIKDAIAQEQAAQLAATTAASGGGGGSSRKGGGGGGRRSSGGGSSGGAGGGATVNPDGSITYSQFAPGDLTDAMKLQGLGTNDNSAAALQTFYTTVAGLTRGLPKGSQQYGAAVQLQTYLMGKGPAGVPDATLAWERTKAGYTNQKQLAKSGKKDAYGQALGNAKAGPGYNWSIKDKLLQQAALAAASVARAKAGITTDANGKVVSTKGVKTLPPNLNAAAAITNRPKRK